MPPLDDAGYGIGVAWADYDRDGDPDLYLANAFGPNRLFRNDQIGSNHWLHINLAGVVSNRGGVGARIRVVTGGVSQIREVSCGSGYVSQGSLTAEFGLGSATTVDLLEVIWPSGMVSSLTVNIPIDQVILVTEGASGTPDLPGVTRLHAPTPNPFNPMTTVAFDLARDSAVHLRFYDLAGRLVRTIVDGIRYEPGTYSEVSNGTDGNNRSVASGVYIVRLETVDGAETRRVALVR